MRVTRPARNIGTTSVLVGMTLATAIAQTQSPPPSPQSSATAVAPQTTRWAASPARTEIKFGAPAATAELVGLTAKSSDGMNLGTVYGVTIEPGAKITSVGVRVGGFLGFGAHLVVLPEGSFYRVNDTLQVNMTADEVNKLPKAEQE
jgi:hypothetical protein